MSGLKKTLTVLSLLIIPMIFTTACNENQTSAETLKKENPADTDYFIGLRYLQNGEEKEARIKFTNSMKNGSKYCAKRSAECLATLGSVQDRNTACELMLELFNDDETKTLAARQFYSAEEYNKVINISDDVDFSQTKNELIKLRLQSFLKRGDKDISKDILQWFIQRQLTSEHMKFLEESYPLPENPDDYNDVQKIISFRVDVFNRDYGAAIKKSDIIIKMMSKAELEPAPLISSDLGKTFLYGTDEYKDSAKQFQKLANLYKKTPAEFYFWFYAGRCFIKAETTKAQAVNCIENAIQCTDDPKLKDNALWYLLNVKIDISFTETIQEIGIYASQWSDPQYFDDLFDSLIPEIFISERWDLFPVLIEQIDGKASDDIVARLSYIWARLIQTDKVSVSGKNDKILWYFERALACGSSYYYRMLALYQLQANNKDFESFMCQTGSNNPIEIDEDAETLLLGYIKYGFPEKLYSEWLNFYKKGISTDVSMKTATFLSKCNKKEFYPQSLRIATRAAIISDRPLKKEEMKLVYPQFYKNYIDNYSKKYDISKSILFALIRSESFFDSDIVSHAGAVGLTQLMEITGEDVARKLKKVDYSLTDPETNIEFGTFYLCELIKRCSDSTLQAFLSYNAGNTRVRRWLDSSMVNYGYKRDMSDDLFLETVPYSETREYGRKLVSATVYYDFLYSDSQNYKHFFKILRGL